MSLPEITHARLNAALVLAAVEADAAEAHGIVCGVVCQQLHHQKQPDVLHLLTAGNDVVPAMLNALRLPLDQMQEEVRTSLMTGDSEFALLLPDDDEAVAVKTEALAHWCQGFLLGLLHDDGIELNKLPENSRELVTDIQTISLAEADDDSADEWSLNEIIEYVRVGTQLIFEELYETSASHQQANGLHQHEA